MTGAIVTWRDWTGKQRRRWFPTQEKADAFRATTPGRQPTPEDYLSDIVQELESHRAVLEAIQNALERLADSGITAAVDQVRDSVDLLGADLEPLEDVKYTLARLERRWPRPASLKGRRQ